MDAIGFLEKTSVEITPDQRHIFLLQISRCAACDRFIMP